MEKKVSKISANQVGASLKRFASAGALAATIAAQTPLLLTTSALAQQTQTNSSQQQTRPGAPPQTTTELPPNSPSSTVRPGNEAQQSVQPQTGVEQQRQQTTPNTSGTPAVSPQVQPSSQQTTPGGLPQTATPAGANTPSAGGVGRPVTSTPGATTTNPAAGTTSPTGTGATAAAGAAAGAAVGTSPSITPAQLPAEPPPIAPNFEAPSRPLPSAERVGVDMANQMPVTLREAIALALQNNNDIDTSRVDVQIAEYQLGAARGVYDPLFSSENYYERRTTPVSSTIGGSQSGAVTQTDATGAVRFGGFSPFAGGNYQFDFSSTRLTTNNQFVTLNPQFPTALTFTYTQPLLRNLRFDINRRAIEIAKKNLSLTDAQFRQQVITVIAQVEQSYWDLVFALRNLQVQIEAVKQARTQVASNQRLVEKGVLAPIDIVAATTQVTTFEQNVYSAQEAVTLAENTLKTLLLPDRASPMWSRPITPVTPVTLEPPPAVLEQAVRSAIENRPEIAQLRTNAEINDIDVRFFRDQTKPQIDLIGTYTALGQAGARVAPRATVDAGSDDEVTVRVNELSAIAGLAPVVVTPTQRVAPEILVGGYDRSLQNLFNQNFPAFRAGVRVALPLRNRTAEANLGSALATGTRIRNQREQLEQIIEADVRNTLQAVRSAEARLAAAAAARLSAEQQTDSEQRQFRAGTTTVFLLLQRQNELLAARGRELQAQTDLNKAIASFQRATGSTLQANNVSVVSEKPADGNAKQVKIKDKPALSPAAAAALTAPTANDVPASLTVSPSAAGEKAAEAQ